MAEQEAAKEQSEEERLKQMAAQMRAAEYKGLSEEEIQERERQKEMRRKKNVEILEDTLSILEKGSYEKDGQERKLQFTPDQMRRILGKIGFRQGTSDFVKSHSNGVKIGVKMVIVPDSYQIADM